MGHKIANYTITKEATCSEKGIETGKCIVCDAKTTREIEMKAHIYGEKVIVKPATTTSVGKRITTCEVCGYIVEEEIPMLITNPSDNASKDKISQDESIVDNSTKNDSNNDSKQGARWWIGILVISIIVITVGAVLILKKQKKNNSLLITTF